MGSPGSKALPSVQAKNRDQIDTVVKLSIVNKGETSMHQEEPGTISLEWKISI